MYFDRILGVLHFMTKEEKRRPAFNQSKEVELVLEFLFELLEKEPNLFERSEIISQIKIFEHKEIKDEYTVKRQELLEKAESVSTVKERLSLLFLDEYFSLKANISSKLKEIINQYANNTDFYKDIIEINTELNQNNSSNFREILSDLTNNNPVMAKELLKFAISNSPEQVCSVSSLLKANYKDTEYFYSTLEEIWNLEFECTKGSVLWLLTYGRNREIELYREDDLKYFEYVVENKLVKQLWSTSFTLSKYILINPIRTLNLIASIFEISENEREDGYILKSIFEEETILQNHKDLIKEFIVSHTQQFPINHHYLKGALHFLENSFGFESLFEYLKVKIELYEKKRETIHLSHHERYINKEKTQEQTERDFIKVIKWHSDLDTKSEYNHKVLVEFLSPKEIETKSFKTNFKVLVDNAGDDIDKIVDLCQTLDVFENKNEQVTSLLIDVANEICKKHNPKKEQLINIFGYNYINNMGVKSGVPGAPFPQDIDKKEEITTILNKYEMHSSVKEVFEYAFKAVEGDIEANIFSDTKW
jgi:hypothetical protein